MAYLLIHTNYKSLAEDAKNLVDEYLAKKITEARLLEVLRAWDTNCPNLLYEDNQKTALSKSVIRYIGKRRSVVIFTMLKSAE